MHDEPCFDSTRALIQTLVDLLEIDDGLPQFFDWLQDVNREAAVAVIG